MTVAAGIEIVTGGHPEPGQSQFQAGEPGEAKRTLWPDGTLASLLPANVHGPESFGSKWQSVLASLSDSIDGLSEEASETAGLQPVGQTSLAHTVGRASGATSILVGAAGLPKNPTTLILTGSRAGIAAQTLPSGVDRQAAANRIEKKTEIASAAESFAGGHSAYPRKGAKPEADTGEAVSTLAVALPGTVPVEVPASRSTNPMVNAAGLRERSLPSDFTDRLPGGVSQHSSQPTKWNSDGSGSVSGLTGHAGETAGDTKPAVESAEQIASGPRDLLNVSLSSGLGNEKQIASAEDGPSTPVRARANSEISIETVTKGQTPTHPRLQGQEMRAIEVPATGLGLNRSSANTTCDISQSSQSLAMAQGAGKPGQGITARASAEDQLRVAQAAKTSQPVRQGHLPPVGQSGNSAPDGSTMPRDPAGSLGTGNTVGNFAGASSGTTPSAASRETFAALDAETASGTPTWIHAGTHRAEAGFNDPALGWISVRADMSGGGIHAALVSGSTDAAQALGGHISGLNAYLAEIHTLVKSLTIAAPGNLDGGSGTNSNASQSMYSGNGEGMGQDTGNGAQAAPQSSGETGSPAMTLATIAARSVPQDATALPHTPEGVHISVMA